MERKLVSFVLLRLRYPLSTLTVSCKISSKVVRKEFIKYFTEQYDHKFIRSSPVVPFCDPTVPFVNAGMNQFKNVFLGQSRPPCGRAVNSQKCVRVGGKHNDLETVGSDGYHHTFFEMLGNWSFGDYFKEDACKMAWNLLTGSYMLNPDRLYVTYFGGDKMLGLEPDFETRDIWLKIGVPSNHIIAFGSSDNFWEMGPSGPCGPCTEIHFDHIANRKNAAERVNLGHHDMVEIWNLVFIQYNRGIDSKLAKLPTFHVDTGMGLERLVAALQNKQSNYDTDLFTPLFNAIQKTSGAPSYGENGGVLDREYRILADHSRLVTVTLADGMFPDQNVKLRRVLRKAFGVAQKAFGCESGLMTELTNYVGESLGETYPEIGVKMKQIQRIINHEEQVFLSLKKTALREWKILTRDSMEFQALNIEMIPGIVNAFKELRSFVSSGQSSGEIPYAVPSDLAYKLYDTYGLDRDTMDALCGCFKLKVDSSGCQDILENTRIASRLSHFIQNNDNEKINNLMEAVEKYKLEPTDDSFKYSYFKEDDYVFPPVSSEVQLIISGTQCVSEVSGEGEYEVLLDKTNLYHESGGQSSDFGHLVLSDETKVTVKDIVNIQGHLIHKIHLPPGSKLSTGEKVSMVVDPDRRLGNMRNHTTTHLINAAINEILQITYQKSNRVTDSSLMFEFAVYGETFSSEHILILDAFVNKAITSEVPVLRKTIDSQELQELHLKNQVTLVPGEVYPQENVHIIEIDVNGIMISREACCGTHVLNAGDIKDFCVTALKSPGTGTRTLWAVTGSKVPVLRARSEKLWERVCDLRVFVNGLVKNNGTREEIEELESHVHNIKKEIDRLDKYQMVHVIRQNCLSELDTFSKTLRQLGRVFMKESLEDEMQEVLDKAIPSEGSSGFVVHYLKCSEALEDIQLPKATRLCPNIPVLLIANSKGMLKAKCCVPKDFVSETFNAKIWMEPVLEVFNAKGIPPRGQDEREEFNMKKRAVKKEDMDTLLSEALENARKLAETALASRTQLSNLI